jgi:ligand-binding SRPBCC domain-containing protein
MLHWQHTHSFIVISDEITEVQDRIEYEYHPGWKNLWTRLLYAPIMLRFLFLYRSWATKTAAQGK